jgi:Transposase DDE domain
MEGSLESGRSDGHGMAHFRSAASRSGRTGSAGLRQAENGRGHPVGSAHWRAVARPAGQVRQLEFGVRALHPLEQAGRVGRGVRDLDGLGASRRRGARHRLHHRAGASACSRRKRGNQRQEALGRSRGGFSTKIHLRTNAKGRRLGFEVTGGEVHDVKGYEALMEPCEAQPEKLLGDKGYDTPTRSAITSKRAASSRSSRGNRTAQNGSNTIPRSTNVVI